MVNLGLGACSNTIQKIARGNWEWVVTLDGEVHHGRLPTQNQCVRKIRELAGQKCEFVRLSNINE